MKKFTWFLLFIAIAIHLSGQNFFRENFDHNKKYILLANPTTNNLKTVNFLVNNGLLKLNPRKVHFVGVYYENQNYNFEKTREFIEINGYNHFNLHEFRGDLNENRLFENNIFSDELKFVFQTTRN